MSTSDTSNLVHGVIPNLAFLLEHNDNVASAYLCTANATQISKTSEEGAHFCGYRNIQMLLAAQDHKSNGTNAETPTISDLQARIEEAWKAGYNSHGMTQTGGIRGTRKHIGTSEVEALLLSMRIPCTGSAFQGKNAWQQLLDYVHAYFCNPYTSSGATTESQRVYLTQKLPIFLQRPGHSLTIVGSIKLRSGKRKLLTFDPAWQPPSPMRMPLNLNQHRAWKLKWLLKQYTKSERYFQRYSAFETLIIEHRIGDQSYTP
ncbi:hypothetical protein KCU81_g7050, partial [Aureobasidium melanogenum]|uniref:UFSP1/2/DUB catalytic domain-containing protein n=1 Tax=Aureobasidium melanogenum (strain CBS 110374) TaxID=1043003 RepID=A0A074VQ46_AURM1